MTSYGALPEESLVGSETKIGPPTLIHRGRDRLGLVVRQIAKILDNLLTFILFGGWRVHFPVATVFFPVRFAARQW